MSLKFTKSTDRDEEVQLDSYLISATWCYGSAIAGQKALFEVTTAFVGNGAPINITGKSKGGKKLGNINDVIKNNKYVGKFDIPESTRVDDQIYFNVKLSGNGLSGESNRIPVRPPVKILSMCWSAEEVRRGDLLTLSVDIEGVRDDTEVILTIYEYDRDGVHDKIVELPGVVQDEKIEVNWEYEYHEDTDEIPSEWEVQEYGGSYNPPEYFFTVKIGETEFGREQESGLLLSQ